MKKWSKAVEELHRMQPMRCSALAADGRLDTYPVALDNLALVLGSTDSIPADYGMRWGELGQGRPLRSD